MKKVINLYKGYEEIINYLIVGVLTTIISLLTYYFLVLTLLNVNVAIELQIANIISWIVSVIFAYFTNRIFVFKSKNNKIFKECISFTGSRILTLLLDMIIMFIFVTVLAFNDKITKLLSQIIIIIGNYIISKFHVFRKN